MALLRSGRTRGAPLGGISARRLLAAWAAAGVAAVAPGPSGAGDAHTEYEVMGAFLVNFARLVEWPAGSFASRDAAVVLGVAADPDALREIEAIASASRVGARSIEVRRLVEAGGAASCHIVFVADSAQADAGDFLHAAAGSPVLTVGEASDFTRLGGVIGFYHEESKLRFEIDTQAAERAGLKISARLLRLARIVPNETSGES